MFRAFRTPILRLAAYCLPVLTAIAGTTLTAVPIEGRGGPEGKPSPLDTTIDLPDEMFCIGLDGDLGYILWSWWYSAGWAGALRGCRLSTYDLSSPAPQAPVGSVNFYAAYRALAADGSFVFLVDDGFAAVDVSDPGNPHTAGTLTWPERLACVAAAGGYAYVGDTAGLHVIDVTDPGSPSLLGSAALSSKAVSVALKGSLALVGTADGKLAVVDVSNPLSPGVVSTFALPGTPWDIAVRGSRAYVADGESGLRILDISRPGKPRLVGSVDTPGDAYKVAVSGARAYVADRRFREWFPAGVAVSDLRVIDISRPAHPVIVNSIAGIDEDGGDGYWDTSEDRGIVASRGRVAVGRSVQHTWLGDCIAILGSCNENSGFMTVTSRSALEPPHPWASATSSPAEEQVADTAPSAPFVLRANDPNPFYPETAIYFDTGVAAQVRVRIFDARGRLVSTLVDETLPPGRHAVSWQGRGEGGQAVPSGIYFVLLEAENTRQTRKITLLR